MLVHIIKPIYNGYRCNVMSFMLFIGPIIGVAVAIIAAVVIISVVAAAVAQKDINDED